jgi:hypothetical protein
MEHVIVNRKSKATKRTLTAVAVVSALVAALSAVARGVISGQFQDYSSPVLGFLGVGLILGLFVALLAINTRLQVEFEDNEQNRQLALDEAQN